MPRRIAHLKRHRGICRECDMRAVGERLHIRESHGRTAPCGEVPVRVAAVARALCGGTDGTGDARTKVVHAADMVEVAVREEQPLDRPAALCGVCSEAAALRPRVDEKAVL